jgi:Recombinase
MAELLKLRAASRLISVSPGRRYRAIANGRLTAASGGGPGKPTLISVEALQTFCRSEGLRVPDAVEIIERSGRLERAERSERSRPVASLPPSSPPLVMSEPKAVLLSRLRTMQAEGLSLQKIADRLNHEGVPSLSSKGRWQKGTIGNLLAQGDDVP